MPKPPKPAPPRSPESWEVREAVDTVARAQNHLKNPHMVKAMKAHVGNAAKVLGVGLAASQPKPMRGKK
jgi:hypothetical protein